MNDQRIVRDAGQGDERVMANLWNVVGKQTGSNRKIPIKTKGVKENFKEYTS